ncbi:hypothetical protein [Cesiribacter andamanensis]|uniref:DUF4157 domain-containing protein n=1 Tax=Cesiribacter andamanensis AMV16 TaxID=1279009 RepID=M7NN66_9BACT|nr:hypothetical protein [Cesiribacter andamanensis]EMR03180.1 hypothetical protein ADICEAN_01658 [Cesiribacter andamanensis AMV16]
MFIRTALVRLITFGFASAISLYPLVLIGHTTRLSRRLVVHERIHLQQQAELLVIPFYVLYGLEYLVRLLHYRNRYRAYRNISFEREAYAHERTPVYLQRRPFWAWRRYL